MKFFVLFIVCEKVFNGNNVNFVSKLKFRVIIFDEFFCLQVEIFLMNMIFGGVIVKFFIIYYNELNMDLYMRVVFEFYFKVNYLGYYKKCYYIIIEKN